MENGRDSNCEEARSEGKKPGVDPLWQRVEVGRHSMKIGREYKEGSNSDGSQNVPYSGFHMRSSRKIGLWQ